MINLKFTCTLRASYLVMNQKRAFALVNGITKLGGAPSSYRLDIDDSAVTRIKKLNKLDPSKY